MPETIAEQIPAFFERFIHRMDEMYAMEDKLKHPIPLAEWHQALVARAEQMQRLYEENEQDFRAYVYPYVHGERAMDHDVAVAFLRGLYELTDRGYQDDYLDKQLARRVAEYWMAQGPEKREVAVVALFVYGFHLATFLHVENRGDLPAITREIREGRRCFQHIIDACPDYHAIAIPRVKTMVLGSYLNMMIFHNIADPQSTGDDMFHWYDELRAYVDRNGQNEDPKCQANIAYGEVMPLNEILLYHMPASTQARRRARQTAERLYARAAEEGRLGEDYVVECMHAWYEQAPDEAYETMFRWLERLYGEFEKSQEVNESVSSMFDCGCYCLMALFRGRHPLAEQQNMADRVVGMLENVCAQMPQKAGMLSMSMDTQEEYLWPCVSRILAMPLRKDSKTRLLLAMNVFRQLSTSIHVQMVALVAEEIMRTILERRPELLVGVNGVASTSEATSRAAELRQFARECALFHDVGKIRIALAINMQYRRMSDEEFDFIKIHPVLGARMLRDSRDLACYSDVALGHHKFYDESAGYPESFDHRTSPYAFYIELIAVADAIDAATDTLGRSYKRAKRFEQVYEELLAGSGTRYSPAIVGVLRDFPELRARLDHIVREERIQTCYHVYQSFIGAEN